MNIGDIAAVPGAADTTYVDTGMYDVSEYGAVYLIDAEEPALVDTGIGTNYERILDLLDAADVAPEDLSYILVTHVHLDHAGGAGLLAAACPDAEVLVNEMGVRHLVDPERLVAGTKAAVGDMWKYYADPEPVPEDRISGLAGGDVVDLGDHALDVIPVPGHAPHQVAFHDRTTDALFVADAAGIYVPAHDGVWQTSPPSNFDLEQCLDDVATLKEREPDVLCYPHFGPKTYEGEMLDEYTRVLSGWVETISDVRADLDDDEAVVDYFVERDGMASVWGEEKAHTEAAMNVRGVLGYLDRAAD
jgi:glyoxylase-like metal-dependent hydrolase (beta-lactamase superfamily II)